MGAQPAAGGGRWVSVPPERLEPWFAGFAERHSGIARIDEGAPTAASLEPATGGRASAAATQPPALAPPASGESTAVTVTLYGGDGAIAECHPAFPPVAVGGRDPLDALVAHAARDRRVGVLLVRLGGFAAGVFDGETLLTSKVDTRLVHGRNRAGGQSSQRFARRREGQARQLIEAAAAVAARVLLPETLDAVVLGGDRTAVDAVLEDRTLAPLRALAVDRFLTVPDPRRAVLEETPSAFRATRIRVVDRPTS